MSDKIYLGSRLSDLDIGEPSLPVSKVILNVDSENRYIAGDNTGFTVEQDCLWATQEMAESVLAKLRGFVYKPFQGQGALLDPAAEIGDAVTVAGTYGVLSSMGRNLDRQSVATIEAPGTDEIEDEYPYKSKQRKKIDREIAKVYSRITKTAEEILLEVTELNGKYTSLSVTIDGVTVEDETGATRIKGSSIETDTLYVKSANITGDLVAAALKGDKINIASNTGAIYGEMSITQSGALYILSGVASGFLLGGTNANPVVTCLGTFYAENVVADNLTTYIENFETRISRLERLFG